MRTCPSCGQSLNDYVSFCFKCGCNVSEVLPTDYKPVEKEPVSIVGWIGRSMIPLIPFIGPLVYFIMLFVWSDDSDKEDSFRNWAKAQLITFAFLFFLGVIVTIVCLSLTPDFYESLY